jgi:hypothetical protein
MERIDMVSMPHRAEAVQTAHENLQTCATLFASSSHNFRKISDVFQDSS